MVWQKRFRFEIFTDLRHTLTCILFLIGKVRDYHLFFYYQALWYFNIITAFLFFQFSPNFFIKSIKTFTLPGFLGVYLKATSLFPRLNLYEWDLQGTIVVLRPLLLMGHFILCFIIDGCSKKRLASNVTVQKLPKVYFKSLKPFK